MGGFNNAIMRRPFTISGSSMFSFTRLEEEEEEEEINLERIWIEEGEKARKKEIRRNLKNLKKGENMASKRFGKACNFEER